jgi:cell division protein FtsA
LARDEVVAGLDIGTTKICCVVGKIENGETLIIGVGTSPSPGITSGVVVDIESTVQAIHNAVSQAAQQAGTEITSVYVGVTGQHIASLNSRGVTAITHPDREINEDDIERVKEQSRVIVLPPDRIILSAIPRSFSIDGQNGIKHPLGMSGTRLEVETHIITAARTFIDNIEKCILRAGLSMDDMVLQPLATAESVLLPDEKNRGVCLVDIGGGTSDLAIFEEGEIYYSSVIPVAGKFVTHDMAIGLTINEEEAENIKLKYGCVTPDLVKKGETVPVVQIGKADPRQLPRETLCHIIGPRMQELFELVLKEIEKSGLRGQLPGGLVLSGGGSLLPGSEECASQILGMHVRCGKPSGLGGLNNLVSTPMHATAVGLVQYGIKQQQKGEEHSRNSNPLSGIIRYLSKLLSRLRAG